MTTLLKLVAIVAFLGLGCLGCSSPNEKEDASKSYADSAKTKADSTFYDDKFVHIDSISKALYNQIPKSDEWFGIDTLAKVKSWHDSLILPIDDGSSSIFLSNTTDGEEYSLSENIGIIKQFPYYIVRISFYEGGTCFLVNKINGKRYELLWKPLISPDKKYLVCIYGSYEGTAHNGIQIWEPNKNELKNIINVKKESFMLEEVKWITDKKLAVSFNIADIKNIYGILSIKK